jgi:hypothetical protein
VLRDYLTRRASRATHHEGSPTAPRHGLLSLRSAVIFAIATATGLAAGRWSEPAFGLGAWVALVIGLDTIIDPESLK